MKFGSRPAPPDAPVSATVTPVTPAGTMNGVSPAVVSTIVAVAARAEPAPATHAIAHASASPRRTRVLNSGPISPSAHILNRPAACPGRLVWRAHRHHPRRRGSDGSLLTLRIALR